jgi:hypothetical protein
MVRSFYEESSNYFSKPAATLKLAFLMEYFFQFLKNPFFKVHFLALFRKAGYHIWSLGRKEPKIIGHFERRNV